MEEDLEGEDEDEEEEEEPQEAKGDSKAAAPGQVTICTLLSRVPSFSQYSCRREFFSVKVLEVMP